MAKGSTMHFQAPPPTPQGSLKGLIASPHKPITDLIRGLSKETEGSHTFPDTFLNTENYVDFGELQAKLFC